MATTYCVQSECGILEVTASSIDDAKEAYSEKYNYDFYDCENIEGSWYCITNYDTGEGLESCGDIPQW